MLICGEYTVIFGPEGEAMSDEVERVLSKTPVLQRALGRFLTVLILIFALWTVRPRSGIMGLLFAVGAIIVGWLKLRA